MEEVDDTLIQILTGIGCPLQGKTSISEFESNDIYAAAVAVLRNVLPDLKLRDTLPSGQAARFRVCQRVADVIKSDLGWVGQLEYQQFLYPNEKDMRRLLMWLVEKLPKGVAGEDLEAAEEAEMDGQQQTLGIGRIGLLEDEIQQALRTWCRERYNPLDVEIRSRKTCAGKDFRTVPLLYPRADEPKKSTLEYFRDHQPLLDQQPPELQKQLAPSVFEQHSILQAILAEAESLQHQQASAKAQEQQRNLASLLSDAFRGIETSFATSTLHQRTAGLSAASTVFTRRAEFMQDRSEKEVVQTKDDSSPAAAADDASDADKEKEDSEKQAEEDLKAQQLAALRAQREQELQKLERRLEKLRKLREKMQEGLEENRQGIKEIESRLGNLETETLELEEAYKIKKQTLDLLPNAAENLKQLQKLAKTSSQRLLALGQEWEQYRAPIVEEIRQKKLALSHHETELTEKVARIKHIKQQLRAQLGEVKHKDTLQQRITAEYQQLPGKQINRQAYVRRIMDIMRNLDKQKEDIRKVLEDVKKLQTEIATVGSKSQRSFAIADEIVYQSAKSKKDPTATQCYQSLVSLRESFIALVDSVETVGKLSVETNEITSQIDGIEQRNTNLNMKRILKDLGAVRAENEELKHQIKAILKP